jgi:hypothetical protein
VGRLPGHDSVHRAVRERQRLGDTGPRIGALDSRPHLGIRLDRHDLAAEPHNHSRQLAGARTDIDNRARHLW